MKYQDFLLKLMQDFIPYFSVKKATQVITLKFYNIEYDIRYNSDTNCVFTLYVCDIPIITEAYMEYSTVIFNFRMLIEKWSEVIPDINSKKSL